jgi:hypothetical protein
MTGIRLRTFGSILLAAIGSYGAVTSSYGACLPSSVPNPLAQQQLDTLRIPKEMPKSLAQYQRYLEDTYHGLDLLRGSNGLIQDAADVLPSKNQAVNSPVQLKITHSETSATNIGIDLLVQAAVAERGPPDQQHALEVMDKILNTLEKEPTYADTGLFYAWYATSGIKATNRNVSSVDNIHLALALWTLSEKFPDSSVGKKARVLFSKMDFSVFYDKTTGLIHGNLSYHSGKKLSNLGVAKGTWTVDAYDYEYFGAEARSLYGVGYALGLFKQEANDPQFISNAVKNLGMELYPTSLGSVLRAWDGGGFQILLPEELLNEDAYSPKLHESASAYGPFTLDQGKKLGLAIPGKTEEYFPAWFSANPQGKDKKGRNLYAAQAGNIPLIASQHRDICDPAKRAFWSRAITMHVGMMAAGIDAAHADAMAPSFSALENYSTNGTSLYHPGLGFSDGVIVSKGNGSADYGQVINQVSAVDQLFFLTGAIRATDPKGEGTSANALQEDSQTRQALAQFYGKVNSKLDSLTPSSAPVQCPPAK